MARYEAIVMPAEIAGENRTENGGKASALYELRFDTVMHGHSWDSSAGADFPHRHDQMQQFGRQFGCVALTQIGDTGHCAITGIALQSGQTS
jgi:hypothetical protein